MYHSVKTNQYKYKLGQQSPNILTFVTVINPYDR